MSQEKPNHDSNSTPSRFNPSLFSSRRARQIQADEGIYHPSAPNLSNSSDNQNPTRDLHPDSNQFPTRGRARAGTLPSSWADLEQGSSGNQPASVGGVDLGLRSIGSQTGSSNRGSLSRSYLAPGSERDRSGTVGSKDFGVGFLDRSTVGSTGGGSINSHKPGLPNPFGSLSSNSSSSYGGSRPGSASELPHQISSPPSNFSSTKGGAVSRFPTDHASPTLANPGISPQPGNRLRSGSLTLPSIGPSIWRESGSDMPSQQGQGGGGGAGAGAGVDPSAWSNTSSSNHDLNERSSSSSNSSNSLSHLQNRLRASTTAGGARPSGGENELEGGEGLLNRSSGSISSATGLNSQGRLRSSTYATKTVGFGGPSTFGSGASSSYENDDHLHQSDSLGSRSRSNSQSHSSAASGAQSPMASQGGSSAASLASAALQNRLGALSIDENPQPSLQGMRPRATTISTLENNSNPNSIIQRKQVYDLGVPTEEDEYEQGYHGSSFGSSNSNRPGRTQGLGSGFNYSGRPPSSFAALSSLAEREPSHFGNDLPSAAFNLPSSGMVGGIPEYDIFTAYALEHGLDPVAFAKAAEAAGLANVLSSPAVAGNHTSSPAKFQGRLRAGTVATLGGPGAGNRMRQELEMMRLNASNSATGISHSLRHGNDENRELDHAFDLATGAGLGAPYGSVSSHHLSSTNSNDPSIHDLAALNKSHGGSSNQSGVHTPGGTLSLQGSSNGQTPNRSLWIGNLDSGTTGQELMQVFAPYGAIESLRLLPEKECGFVNFVEIADAIRARDDVLNRLGGRIGSSSTGPDGQVRIGYGKIDAVSTGSGGTPGVPTPSRLFPGTPGNGMDSLPGTPGTGESPGAPTRALWIGSIPSSTTTTTLLNLFAPFGPIESVRILTHKNCGFINFERVDDAVRARKALNGRDALGTEVGAVRVGFAKVPVKNSDGSFSNLDSNSGFAEALDQLQNLKGSKLVSAEEQLESGNLEDYRSNMVLNLMHLQRQQLQQSQSSSNNFSTTGTAHASSESRSSGTGVGGLGNAPQTLPGTSASNSIVPSSDKGGVPLPAEMVPRATVSDQQLMMRELSEGEPDYVIEQDVASVADFRPPVTYYSSIPLVSEVSSNRRFDTARLRDLRKTMDSGSCSVEDIDSMALEFINDIVDLASDYIGNTVVQKFFENCSESVKLTMLERIAPHLAMIGIHKNGTWAAQKIIDSAKTPEQINIVAQHLRPYVPPLLLDQFGNYVVQCVMPFKDPGCNFVFDAMMDRCWEVAQGRFGARSMRACLENSHVSRLQQKRVAISIVLNSVPLATSPNGTLLLTWLLDQSNLPGRYRLLTPRFQPHLIQLCTHKLASLAVLRIVNQKNDPESSRRIVKSIFENSDEKVLEEILTDQVHGSQFITKVLSSTTLDPDDKSRYIEMVKRIVLEHKLSGVPAYRRLIEELGLPVPPPPGGQLVGNLNSSSMGTDAGFSPPSAYGGAEQAMLLNQMHPTGLGPAMPLPRSGNGMAGMAGLSGMSPSMSAPFFGRSPSIDSLNPFASPTSPYQGQSPHQGMPHSNSSHLGFSPVSSNQSSQRFAPMTPRSAAARDTYGSPYANLAGLQSPPNYGMQMSPQSNFHPMGYAPGFPPPPPPPQQQPQPQQQQRSPYQY